MNSLKVALSIVICFFVIRLSFGADPKIYSIADLEVLEAQKSYEEFLLHARDIRPSKRDKHWVEMVSSMATGFIDFKLERKEYKQKTFQFIEKISLWPVLREDEFFQIKRSRYATQYLSSCFSNHITKSYKAICLKELKQFWHSAKKTPELGMKLAELVKAQEPSEDLWTYYAPATNSEVAEFHCQRNDVQQALYRELAHHEQKGISEKELKNLIDELTNQDCWKLFSKSLTHEMLTHDDRSFQNTAYQILSAKDALSQEQKDLFLTLFVLQGPIVGNIFNQAWKTLEKLGQDHDRRQKVLKALRNTDPLPGKVFITPDLSKRKTLLNFLSTNIPEYLDHYARTCIDYYDGKRTFPRGNPTMECRELFKFSKDTKWIDQGLQIRYSGLKKL